MSDHVREKFDFVVAKNCRVKEREKATLALCDICKVGSSCCQTLRFDWQRCHGESSLLAAAPLHTLNILSTFLKCSEISSNCTTRLFDCCASQNCKTPESASLDRVEAEQCFCLLHRKRLFQIEALQKKLKHDIHLGSR